MSLCFFYGEKPVRKIISKTKWGIIMLFLVRINVLVRQKTARNGRGVVHMAGNIDVLWDFIMENHKKWRRSGIHVLYVTHRSMHEDISMFVDVKEQDKLAEFLVKKIAPMSEVKGFWVFNLMQSRFFQIPSGIPHMLTRFTITITAKPQYYKELYNTLANYLPTQQIIPAYVAYTFHGFKSDIIMSVLADGQTTVNEFVNKYIVKLDGVTRTEITRISKTERLVSAKEWVERAGSHFIPLKGKKIENFEKLEDDWIAGC